eukprot:TRINITY_DN7768_c0_g1_i1.p3 TRINITY_DN7768_c0_g1~~TRINITY_DN7768_c0_g1_i1.p3  ORF type:complete len:212 (+),score=40.77 TRINITY_DN7768_c0_g1_i1:74-637(+)
MSDEVANGRETKRARKDFEGYLLNIQNAVVSDYAGKSFGELLEAPISALQGIEQKGEEALNEQGIKSVRQLAEWPLYRTAKAITILAALVGDKRPEGSCMNIDKAITEDNQKKSLKEICAANVSSLQGIHNEHVEKLSSIQVTSVEDLGNSKICEVACAILELSRFESMNVQANDAAQNGAEPTNNT